MRDVENVFKKTNRILIECSRRAAHGFHRPVLSCIKAERCNFFIYSFFTVCRALHDYPYINPDVLDLFKKFASFLHNLAHISLFQTFSRSYPPGKAQLTRGRYVKKKWWIFNVRQCWRNLKNVAEIVLTYFKFRRKCCRFVSECHNCGLETWIEFCYKIPERSS